MRDVIEIRVDDRPERRVIDPKYHLKLECGHVVYRFLLRGRTEDEARCTTCGDARKAARGEKGATKCPMVGTKGVHSQGYYDGDECAYCHEPGKVKEA